MQIIERVVLFGDSKVDIAGESSLSIGWRKVWRIFCCSVRILEFGRALSTFACATCESEEIKTWRIPDIASTETHNKYTGHVRIPCIDGNLRGVTSRLNWVPQPPPPQASANSFIL
jgi:hypothetical protein